MADPEHPEILKRGPEESNKWIFASKTTVRPNLTEADLTASNLAHAYLLGADFSGADLSRADLSQAIYTEPRSVTRIRPMPTFTGPTSPTHTYEVRAV
jgi:hypothetical protein